VRPVRDNGNSDVTRYRRAAEEALRQLDWCVEYLRRINKPQVATRLAKNRDYIRKNLMGERPRRVRGGHDKAEQI
jgi:predicted transcriptional regulator of viral defense system